MNIEYLEEIDKINLNLLPTTIENEYNKIRFLFDIDIMGTYFSRNAFNNLYADIYRDLSEKELIKRQLFNENLRNCNDAYCEGFSDGNNDIYMLEGIPKEEDQIFKVFGLVYKKIDSINKPSILQFKKSINAYNSLDFLHHHLANYGKEVGRFIFGWRIILNNIKLFENIFDEYLGAKTNQSKEDSIEPDESNEKKVLTLESLLKEQNKLLAKITIEEVYNHFKILTTSTNKNNQFYLTNEQLLIFIYSTFVEQKPIKQKFNCNGFVKTDLRKIFYSFYFNNKLKETNLTRIKRKYFNIMNEGFEGFTETDYTDFAK